MIFKGYSYTLRLICDGCGKEKTWKNKGEYPNTNMKGNIIEAKKEGWSIIKYTCKCPKCRKDALSERGEKNGR